MVEDLGTTRWIAKSSLDIFLGCTNTKCIVYFFLSLGEGKDVNAVGVRAAEVGTGGWLAAWLGK
jgi:hypothetical protein